MSLFIPNSKNVRETARDIFVRMQDESVSNDEQMALENWLDKDPSHREAYQEFAQLWQSLSDLGKSEHAGALKKSIDRSRVLGGLSDYLHYMFTGYRGLVTSCCLFLAMFTVYHYYPLNEPVSFITEKGEIKNIILPDGSDVFLSAKTHVQYSESRYKREVTLISGEAFFEVIKDSRRPFSVKANELSVRVVGTKFNINIGEDQTRVDVLEGTVKVSPLGGSELLTRTLTKNEGVIKPDGESMQALSGLDLSNVASWREGYFRYQAVTLQEILHDVNRFYPGKIVLADKALAQERISASFSIATLENVPEILSEILPVKPIRNKNDVVVLVRR